MSPEQDAGRVGLLSSERELLAQLRRFTFFDSHLHGPAHWVRVHRFGLILADNMNLEESQARCVEVFAWTHDLARVDDGGGNQHALDGAAHAFPVMDALFDDLNAAERQLVSAAIRHHSDGMTADEAYFQGVLDIEGWTEDELVETVAACWDADRLDLLRLGVPPNARYMSTECWRDVLPYSQKLHSRREQAD